MTHPLEVKKHKVFRSEFAHPGHPQRWRVWCPYSFQTYSFPTWELALELRGCCAANEGKQVVDTSATTFDVDWMSG